MTYSAAEKYADAMREVRLRQKVYDRLVNVNSLSRETAKKRIEIMTEIAEDYRQLAKKELLFDEDLIPPAHSKAHPRNPRSLTDVGLDRAGLSDTKQDTEAGPAQADSGRVSGGHAGPSSDVPPDTNRADGEIAPATGSET